MAAAPYQPAAGPSRHFNQTMPPPLLSQSLSPAYAPTTELGGGRPWSNGPSADQSDVNDAGGDKGEGSKRNPLVDLIDSEKTYVDQLGLVIRRVAAAWSRKDFPPPKLDAMFRCVEAVYRANRAFGTKLKEIGPNPSSPKALGDLLMRWIDDLEPSYNKYASTFMSAFDSYPTVMKNPLLPSILVDISTMSPPPPPLTEWSLDALFILPYTRLRYYRKLYARLLRSTKEGRSDHRLLVVANQRLETLVSDVESRLEVDVAEDVEAPSFNSGDISREGSWPINERVSRSSSALDSSIDSHQNSSPFSSRIEDARTSGGSAATSIDQSPQRRPGHNMPKMPAGSSSLATPSSPVAPLSDLEYKIDPERTLDLFTMQPKKCKLQMSPSNLPFDRFLRSSHDVTVYLTPRCTGQQVVHSRGHVFILSDLFLLADWMDAMDKAAKAQQVAREQPERVGQGGPMPEMWLSYPPLAGKHLSVAEGQQANVLTITIMRKETFIIHAESEVARDQMLKDLIDCIDFASGGPPRPSQNQPEFPGRSDTRSPSLLSDQRSMDSNYPPIRSFSPFSPDSSPSASPRPGETPHVPPPPMAGNALVSQMNKFSLEPGDTAGWQRGPSPPGPVAVLPPRGASLRPNVPPINTQSLPAGSMPSISHSDYSDSSMPNQNMYGSSIPRSPSGRSVQSAPRQIEHNAPPVPAFRGAGSHYSDTATTGMFNGYPPPSRSRSAEPLYPPEPPSARFAYSPGRGSLAEETQGDSPPMSPVEEEDSTALTGPAIISAQMKCKVFLKQSHQQWKSLGAAKLKLYSQAQGNVKQLVVESDSSSKAMLISTIILTDGVERVAKTGVAVEISDRGKRTGIIYMIQLRNEKSAGGLFESLLAGSDRTAGAR